MCFATVFSSMTLTVLSNRKHTNLSHILSEWPWVKTNFLIFGFYTDDQGKQEYPHRSAGN